MGIVTNYYVPELGMNTYYLCRGLARLGINVTLFASGRYGTKKPVKRFAVGEIEEPFGVVRVPTLFSIANVPVMTRLSTILQHYQFDLLQTEDAYQLYSYSAVRWAKNAGVPVLLRHDLSGPPSVQPYKAGFELVERLMSRKVIEGAAAAIAPTQDAADYLHRLRPDLVVHLIPFGIDTEQFKPGPKGQGSPILTAAGNGSPLVLTVARLVPSKGIEDLVLAIALVKRRCPDVRLVVVGKGPLKPTIVRLASRLGVTSNMTFIDSIRHDEIHSIYNDCDVFVLPSHEEAQPLTIMEAMACGKAIVSTDIPGVSGLVQDGVNGILVKPGDFGALGESILRIRFEPNLGSTLGTNARKSVDEVFAWEKICDRIAQIYRTLVSR